MTVATAIHARSCPGTCPGSRADVPKRGHVGGHPCMCVLGGTRVAGCYLRVGIRRCRRLVLGMAPSSSSSSRLRFRDSSATFCW